MSVKLIGEHNNNNNRNSNICSNGSSGNSGSTTNNNDNGNIASSTTSSSTTTNNPILGADGYLIDFTMIKQITRKICKDMNEHFICPIYSDVLDISTISMPNNNINNDTTTITTTTEYIQIICSMDGTKFLFPKNDCILLPIVHATAEELAIYIYCQILNQITIDYLLLRNIYMMEITVAEAPTQQATFRYAIPTPPSMSIGNHIDISNNNHEEMTSTTTENSAAAASSSSLYNIDVRQFIMSGNIVPMPCLTQNEIPSSVTGSSTTTTATTTTTNVNTTAEIKDRTDVMTTTNESSEETTTSCQSCNGGCPNHNNFESQMQRVMEAIHDGRLIVAAHHSNDNDSDNKQPMTIPDLEQLLKLQ